MKYIRKYENYIKNYEDIINLQVVKCNWCNWIGLSDQIPFNDDINEEFCPNCEETGYLMDKYLFDDDFLEYVKNNEPEKYTTDNEYNSEEDIINYYKELYPIYFASKKYNL